MAPTLRPLADELLVVSERGAEARCLLARLLEERGVEFVADEPPGPCSLSGEVGLLA